MTTPHEFGNRSRAEDRRRIALLALLGVLLVAVELTLGAREEQAAAAALAAAPDYSWIERAYLTPGSAPPAPEKRGARVAYISNSHARTGGFVARHLQSLLGAVCEGGVEIAHLSSAGMFAPEFLQRFAAAVDDDLDALVLPVTYISFSDRMPLARQSLTARSMWQPAVRPKLPAGFWLRNYDIGIYADALITRYWRSYRHRNGIRDRLERPLASALRRAHASPIIPFLEVDEFRYWRFPEGFDRNLFQWRLYSSGRDGHLADMRALVALARSRGVPVLAFNLPVHWEKEPREVDTADVARYRQDLRAVFGDAAAYVDYEEAFPKAFSTYDAIHPTWHGARLHAFDLALRLEAARVIGCRFTPQALLGAFERSDSGVSEAYRRALDGDYPPLERPGFRRFDVTEPANARLLMRRLASLPPGSVASQQFLDQLALRTRYWLDGTPEAEVPGPDWKDGVRAEALALEAGRGRDRIRFFLERLGEYRSRQLAAFPLPALGDAPPDRPPPSTATGGAAVKTEVHELNGGGQAQVYLDTASERRIAVVVVAPDRPPYVRVDVFGDGTFAQLFVGAGSFVLPPWVRNPVPAVDFGI